MKKIDYNKIVRDHIPEIIESSQKKASYEYVDSENTVKGLEAKLSEELAEYFESHKIEELADLLEVIHGILYHQGISWNTLEAIRLQKKNDRGGFEKGIRLISIEEP